MNDEIKEILDRLEKISYYAGVPKELAYITTNVTPQEIKLLLDYITNLQTTVNNCKEENEKEKQFIKDCGFQNQQQLALMYLDYKSRCEKAVEYIKKDTRWFDSKYASIYGELCDCEGYNANRLEVMVNPSNLLNILQNGSENK